MSRRNTPNRLRLGFAALVAACFASATSPAQTSPPTAVDLPTYVRVGRYDLPEPTRTTAPINSLLAQQASGITYNWDADTLFVVGDGGRCFLSLPTIRQKLARPERSVLQRRRW